MRPLRVLIADDHEDVLSALVDLVGSDPRFVVEGTATNGYAAVEFVRAHRLDIALIDVRMPGGGPLASEALLALEDPPVVVAISADSGPGVMREMTQAGAVAVLVKGWIGATLPDQLMEAWAGDRPE
jgi:DNA-binding NarL/FixJ family response regulator